MLTQIVLTQAPDRLIVRVAGLSLPRARKAALIAVQEARARCPRVSGETARALQPIYAKGYFGVLFTNSWVWYQEQGTKPFIMNSLKDKTIPMWVSDEDFSLRRKNPKIKTRTTEDGRLQVLIFRRATKPGARQISKRNAKGQIASGNKPIAWRHPGLQSKHFIGEGLTFAVRQLQLNATAIYAADSTWNPTEVNA